MRRTMTVLVLVLSLAFAAGCKKQDTPPEDNNPPASVSQPPGNTGGNDNNNGNGEGTTAPTTTPSTGGIRLGNVELDPEEIAELQARADAGEDQWLLDPLAVAKRLAPDFGFSSSATFNLVSQTDSGPGSGTGEAIVQIVHNGNLYYMQLIQPNGPGEGSIWWVNAVLRDAK